MVASLFDEQSEHVHGIVARAFDTVSLSLLLASNDATMIWYHSQRSESTNQVQGMKKWL